MCFKRALSGKESLAFTKPDYFKFLSAEGTVRNWTDLYISICNELTTNYPEQFVLLAGKSLSGNTQALTKKKNVYGEYRKVRKEMKELQMVKANVGRILGFEKKQESRHQQHEQEQRKESNQNR